MSPETLAQEVYAYFKQVSGQFARVLDPESLAKWMSACTFLHKKCVDSRPRTVYSYVHFNEFPGKFKNFLTLQIGETCSALVEFIEENKHVTAEDFKIVSEFLA